MKTTNIALDVGVGLFAGLAAIKLTEYAQQALWAATPEETRQREQRVRPGPPFRVAAEKAADLADLDPGEQETQAAGRAFHYASGVGWARFVASCAGQPEWSRSARAWQRA